MARQSLLNEADFDEAPQNNQAKFVFLANLAQQRMFNTAPSNSIVNIDDSIKREYLAILKEAASILDIVGLPPTHDNSLDKDIHELITAIAAISTRTMLLVERPKTRALFN